MATKQEIYTQAINVLGGRKSLTSESTETTRVFDDQYDAVVEECLSAGSWNFATQTIKVTADTGVEPAFGYTEVFAKPTDWLRTHGLSGDEYLSFPLLEYHDDNETWSADFSPIYVRYVSNDTGLGLELTKWPALFTRYVAMELAARCAYRLTQSSSLEERVEKKRDKAKRTALNQDAMDEPTKFKPPGAWTQSRQGRSSGRDRGSRGSLTG